MSCSCNDCDDITILPGNPGTDGTDGTDGNDGLYGGYSSKWKVDPGVVIPNPPTSYLRFNDLIASAVTEIYINETNFDTVDMSVWLDSFNSTGDFGYIRIYKEFDASTFWIGKITNQSDLGGYRTLTVTYILHNGLFLSNDGVVVTFTPSALGSAGAELQKTIDQEQVVISATDALAPGAYGNLFFENTTGSTQQYEITVDFNVGKETPGPPHRTASIGVTFWTGSSPAFTGGVKIWECLNHCYVATDSEEYTQGQSFTLLHSPPDGATVQLLNGEFMDVRFRSLKSVYPYVNDPYLNQAILTVKQL
jgi:hypothetical protein